MRGKSQSAGEGKSSVEFTYTSYTEEDVKINITDVCADHPRQSHRV
jgi:hypothetical protein